MDIQKCLQIQCLNKSSTGSLTLYLTLSLPRVIGETLPAPDNPSAGGSEPGPFAGCRLLWAARNGGKTSRGGAGQRGAPRAAGLGLLEKPEKLEKLRRKPDLLRSGARTTVVPAVVPAVYPAGGRAVSPLRCPGLSRINCGVCPRGSISIVT